LPAPESAPPLKARIPEPPAPLAAKPAGATRPHRSSQVTAAAAAAAAATASASSTAPGASAAGVGGGGSSSNSGGGGGLKAAIAAKRASLAASGPAGKATAFTVSFDSSGRASNSAGIAEAGAAGAGNGQADAVGGSLAGASASATASSSASYGASSSVGAASAAAAGFSSHTTQAAASAAYVDPAAAGASAAAAPAAFSAGAGRPAAGAGGKGPLNAEKPVLRRAAFELSRAWLLLPHWFPELQMSAAVLWDLAPLRALAWKSTQLILAAGDTPSAGPGAVLPGMPAVPTPPPAAGTAAVPASSASGGGIEGDGFESATPGEDVAVAVGELINTTLAQLAPHRRGLNETATGLSQAALRAVTVPRAAHAGAAASLLTGGAGVGPDGSAGGSRLPRAALPYPVPLSLVDDATDASSCGGAGVSGSAPGGDAAAAAAAAAAANPARLGRRFRRDNPAFGTRVGSAREGYPFPAVRVPPVHVDLTPAPPLLPSARGSNGPSASSTGSAGLGAASTGSGAGGIGTGGSAASDAPMLRAAARHVTRLSIAFVRALTERGGAMAFDEGRALLSRRVPSVPVASEGDALTPQARAAAGKLLARLCRDAAAARAASSGGASGGATPDVNSASMLLTAWGSSGVSSGGSGASPGAVGAGSPAAGSPQPQTQPSAPPPFRARAARVHISPSGMISVRRMTVPGTYLPSAFHCAPPQGRVFGLRAAAALQPADVLAAALGLPAGLTGPSSTSPSEGAGVGAQPEGPLALPSRPPAPWSRELQLQHVTSAAGSGGPASALATLSAAPPPLLRHSLALTSLSCRLSEGGYVFLRRLPPPLPAELLYHPEAHLRSLSALACYQAAGVTALPLESLARLSPPTELPEPMLLSTSDQRAAVVGRVMLTTIARAGVVAGQLMRHRFLLPSGGTPAPLSTSAGDKTGDAAAAAAGSKSSGGLDERETALLSAEAAALAGHLTPAQASVVYHRYSDIPGVEPAVAGASSSPSGGSASAGAAAAAGGVAATTLLVRALPDAQALAAAAAAGLNGAALVEGTCGPQFAFTPLLAYPYAATEVGRGAPPIPNPLTGDVVPLSALAEAAARAGQQSVQAAARLQQLSAAAALPIGTYRRPAAPAVDASAPVAARATVDAGAATQLSSALARLSLLPGVIGGTGSLAAVASAGGAAPASASAASTAAGAAAWTGGAWPAAMCPSGLHALLPLSGPSSAPASSAGSLCDPAAQLIQDSLHGQATALSSLGFAAGGQGGGLAVSAAPGGGPCSACLPPVPPGLAAACGCLPLPDTSAAYSAISTSDAQCVPMPPPNAAEEAAAAGAAGGGGAGGDGSDDDSQGSDDDDEERDKAAAAAAAADADGGDVGGADAEAAALGGAADGDGDDIQSIGDAADAVTAGAGTDATASLRGALLVDASAAFAAPDGGADAIAAGDASPRKQRSSTLTGADGKLKLGASRRRLSSSGLSGGGSTPAPASQLVSVPRLDPGLHSALLKASRLHATRLKESLVSPSLSKREVMRMLAEAADEVQAMLLAAHGGNAAALGAIAREVRARVQGGNAVPALTAGGAAGAGSSVGPPTLGDGGTAGGSSGGGYLARRASLNAADSASGSKPHPPTAFGLPGAAAATAAHNPAAAVAKRVQLLSRIPPLAFESRFECGNLCAASRVGPLEYELSVDPDTNTAGHTQWFFFRVRGLVCEDGSAVTQGPDGTCSTRQLLPPDALAPRTALGVGGRAPGAAAPAAAGSISGSGSGSGGRQASVCGGGGGDGDSVSALLAGPSEGGAAADAERAGGTATHASGPPSPGLPPAGQRERTAATELHLPRDELGEGGQLLQRGHATPRVLPNSPRAAAVHDVACSIRFCAPGSRECWFHCQRSGRVASLFCRAFWSYWRRGRACCRRHRRGRVPCTPRPRLSGRRSARFRRCWAALIICRIRCPSAAAPAGI
jgi:hypothetical protein